MKNIKFLNRPIVFEEPELILDSSAWLGHIPFAFWIVDALRPKNLVELGTHTGCSYAAFVQAVKTLKLDAACFAVDTWQGDPHSGFYGDEIYRDLAAFHDAKYASFSRLIRSTFDDAIVHFPDRSIDLLHIDGYHTYEAVTHDFNAWLPKVSDRGVMLFHDVNVRERDFGVWRFWDEVKTRYPSFTFLHSHGLGVLAVGKKLPAAVRWLVSQSEESPDTVSEVRRFFGRLGGLVPEAGARRQLSSQVAKLSSEASQRQLDIRERDERVNTLDAELAALRASEVNAQNRLAQSAAELTAVQQTLVQRSSEESARAAANIKNNPNPTFVIGSYRSGTSILGWALGQHPNVLYLEETSWIGYLGVAANNCFDIGTANGRLSHLGAVGVGRKEFLEHFGATVDSFIRESIDQYLEHALRAGVEDSSLVTEHIKLIRDARAGGEIGKTRWIDATPENSHYVYGLHKLFPEAKFIHIVRNPDDVAKSLMYFDSAGGKSQGAQETYETWMRLVTAAFAAEQALGSSKVLRIFHSDLVADPEATIKKCLAFTGEAYDENCLSPLKVRLNSSKYPADFVIDDDSQSVIEARSKAAELYKALRVKGTLSPSRDAYRAIKGKFVEYASEFQPAKLDRLWQWARTRDSDVVQRDHRIVELQAEVEALNQTKVAYEQTREQLMQSQQQLTERDQQSQGLASELVHSRNELELQMARVQQTEAQAQQLIGQLGQSQILVGERDQQIGVMQAEIEALNLTKIAYEQTREQLIQSQQQLAERDQQSQGLASELVRSRNELEQQMARVQQTEAQAQQLVGQLNQSQVLVGERDQQIGKLQAEIQALNLTKVAYEQTREQLAQSQQRLAERDEQNKGLASELVYSRNELELRSARIQRIEVQTQQLQSKLEQSESAVDDLGQQIKVSEQTLAAEQGLISLRNTQLTALLQDLAQKDAELSIRETEVQRAAAALEEQKRDLLNLDTRLSEALRQLSTTQAGVHERNGVIARLTKTAEDREYRLREIEACLTDAQTELTSLRTSLRDRDLQNSNTLTAMAEKVRVLRAELARFADAEQQRALQLEQNIKIRFPAEEINTLPVDAVIQSVNENVEVGVESVQMSMRAAYGNVVAIGDHTSVMATGAGAGTDEQTTLRRPLLVASNNTPGRSEAVAVQTEIDRARAELARAGANYAKNEAGSVASLRLLDKQAAELEKLRCEKEEESKRLAAVSERARERELEAASLAQQIAERESKIACLDKSIAERDSQLAELTDETVRRGIWALGLDQQLKETQAKIAQITSSNSWKATLPLREMRRWVVAPTSQAKRYFTSSAKLAKSVYTRLPISRQTKVAHRHLLSKHAPWALRAAGSYPLAIPALHVPTAAARSAENPIVGRTNISLARSAQPIVSVIIPIYGKCEYTLRCLTSIAANLPSAPFEVIVVDDCSPDNSAEILGEVHGIRLISSAQNQGFIRSCNVGAKAANGQYLYFLNNDTEVTAGWLDELLRTFHEFPGTGLVGSKLMYPNGTLQEAGGIIWQDGSAWNFGRNQDPALPVYNYAREVDYCSGASIMTPKELFESLNGFDEHYLPAYCEDSDLALKIRDHGHRVICQPRSVVVHYEGVTSGTDTTQGTKAYQIENSKKLFERWKDRLHHHQANGINVDSAKDRTAKRRVLVLDHCTPTPNQDAGSVTVFNLLLLLREMDFQVTFIPEDNFLYMPDYTPALQRVGIEVLYAPYYTSIEQHLKEAGERYDLAFLFRPGVVERHLQAIRKHCAKAKVLFHTVDLHFLRMSREAQLQSDVAKQKAADEMKQRELTAIRASDASIVHSTAEFELLRPEVPDAKLHVFPLIMDVVGSGKEFSERKDIVFIGGYQHTPNVDAVKYFVAEIMPLIRRRLPGVHFYAVGSKPPTDIQTLACEDVIITGFVENLAPLLDKMRVSVAPLRYGAGIKGKIGSAMAVGLPVVATPLAAEGMSLSDGENILVASGAEQFADAVVSLYKNESLWDRISHRGLQFAENAWGAEAAWKTLSLILAGLDIATHRRAHPLSLFSSLDVAKKKEKQLSVKLTPVASLQNREEFCLAWKNESLAHIRQIEKSLIESSGNEAFSVDGYCAPCNMQVSFIVDKRSAVQLHEHDWLPNWRERLECPQCRMNSRQRLMATLIKQTLQVKGKKSVYFMEQVTPIYAWATSTFKNHRIVGSEYLGHEFEGGAVIKGLRHEDVEHLSFTEGALDLIVSNDVFEHVPNPARAFSECVRVLRPGGIMLATIPFHHVADTSEARATLSSKGIEHLLPPMYHGNPVSADGSLVFTDFGWDILGNLRKAGFSNACVEIYASAEHGILGGGQIVFVATKEA